MRGVEDVEQGIELGQCAIHLLGLAERELEVSASQPELAFTQSGGQALGAPEVADRAEIDADIPSAAHPIEQRQWIGHVGINPDRDLEGPVTHRSVGHQHGVQTGSVAARGAPGRLARRRSPAVSLPR